MMGGALLAKLYWRVCARARSILAHTRCSRTGGRFSEGDFAGNLAKVIWAALNMCLHDSRRQLPGWNLTPVATSCWRLWSRPAPRNVRPPRHWLPHVVQGRLRRYAGGRGRSWSPVPAAAGASPSDGTCQSSPSDRESSTSVSTGCSPYL